MEKRKIKAEDILSSSEQYTANDELVNNEEEKLANSIKEIIASSGNEKLEPAGKKELWENILADLSVRKIEHRKNIALRWKWYAAAAAAIFIFFSIGVYFSSYREVKPTHLVNQTKAKFRHDILPGGNKAVLTLAGGSNIVLDNAEKGLLSSQGDTKIEKTADGQVSYERGSQTHENVRVALNTITTPKGGQYEIILPDGTKAWLNAASSLTFPTAFTGRERNVKLTGEVYFEVAKNKNMPFKVNVNGAVVEVLGTHFNIMAYNDEHEMKTTLLEGSVKVSKNGAPILLKPGQQALLSNLTGGIKVQPANIDAVIAWQKGYYLFKGENITSIMRNLSRWYNVDVDYKGNFVDKDFSGRISRFKNISEVLRLLELTDDVHFKMEGRRLTVMP